MLFEVIREIMIEPHPQPGISIGNQFHKLPPRIAYIDLRIVSCATPALFFTFPHCTSRINHYFYVVDVIVIFRDYNKGGQQMLPSCLWLILGQPCKTQ